MPKPPSKEVKAFRVRVDGEDDARMVEFCKNLGTKFLLVHHVLPTGNPHYHFYAETTLTQGNLSNQIKKKLGVTGGDYSNKSCDMNRKMEYLSYLFNTKKGNVPRVVAYVGFNMLDIATMKENSEKIAHEYKVALQRSKKTQFQIVELVMERIPDNKVWLPEVVYEYTIETLQECRTMARPNHVRDIIATVMAYSKNRKAKEIVRDLTLKFFS